LESGNRKSDNKKEKRERQWLENLLAKEP
jgi:hypothetical protein